MKLTNNGKLMNRLIANKLIQDLSSYLSYFYSIFYLHPRCYLVFYQHRWLSCSIGLFASYSVSSFVNVNSFISWSVQYIFGYIAQFFVSIDGFVSYSVQFFVSCNIKYQAFSFISEHPTRSISKLKGLLDFLVGPSLSRSSYLYGASWILHYTMRVCLLAIKF